MVADLYQVTPEELRNSIIQGYQMAVISGPLCDEPMMGVCYIVDKISANLDDINLQNLEEN